MKLTIDLKPLLHRGSEQIGIYFKNDLTLNILIRKEASGVWSQTKKCWYVPLNRSAFDRLRSAVKDHAVLETKELKKFLAEREQIKNTSNQLVRKNNFLFY